MAFQTVINQFPAPAVEGDFASANTRTSALSAGAANVAGSAGVVIGRFAWMDASGITVANTGSGVPDGFVHREQQALITAWLGAESMLIPEGISVTLLNQGDFWGRTSTAATKGQKIFASTTDGSISTAAAGGTVAGAVETKFKVANAVAAGELVKFSSWA